MLIPEKNIAIACNPSVQNAKALKVIETIVRHLSVCKIQHAVFSNHWPLHWEGFTEVWIIGGDGTANYFINQFPRIQLPLAFFPGGSGNDWRWMLYGDMSVGQQIEKVLQAVPQPVDAGICNGRLFLNGVGIGFDGAVVRDLIGKKKVVGKRSYLLSVLKNIFYYRETLLRMETKNETIEQDCFMLSVANGGRYGGGFRVAPKADVTDGLLDVNIIGNVSLPKRIRYLPVIEKGKHLHLPFVRYEQTDGITIQSAQPLQAHIDGEAFCAAQFEIRCLPKRFSLLR